MLWSAADLADAIEVGLRSHAHALDVEHAVYGLDARDELELQPVIADALATAGYGVEREQRYPSDRAKRKRSEGERCDFVVTPDARDLQQPDAAGTLFDADDAVELSDACWLELKVVNQFTIDGANAAYSTQLLSTVRRDVTKLSKDMDILHAMVVLLLFVASEHVASHDLGVWQDRCLQRSLPIGAPAIRHVPINDRLGNRVCTVAVYPVRHL